MWVWRSTCPIPYKRETSYIKASRRAMSGELRDATAHAALDSRTACDSESTCLIFPDADLY